MPERSASPALQLRFDKFELDEANARLARDGKPVTLPPKAFDVLCALARRPGQLLTKNDLLDAVWGHQHVSESVLKTTISELRAALGDDAKQPRYIETASRRGYRFIGAPQAAPSVAPSPLLPPFTPPAADPATRMIGRARALAVLRDAWNHALAARRQLVWIAGDAGVGKTTLLEAFLSELDPAQWVQGNCMEQFGAGEPYLPVLDCIAVVCRRAPELVAQLKRGAPTWFLQMPWLSSEAERTTLARELAGTNQERMVSEIREVIDAWSMTHPVAIVIEDLHWSDQATLKLMEHFVKRKAPARILWVATFRLASVISEDHPLKALRHDLRLHRLCTEIGLDTFTEAEVADYVGARHPDLDVSEAFVRALHQHTDGLPLFVANVVDELASQGHLQSGGEAPDAEAVRRLSVPESLAGVIESQIARLPREVRDVLEAASVCGVEFRTRVAAVALQRDRESVEAACEELARRAQWLQALALSRLPDGSLDARYAFRHALYRHVFYQRIGSATRAALHQRVARAMEAERADGVGVAAAELASHYELGHDPLPALRCCVEAAEHALGTFAPAEGVAMTSKGKALLPQCPAGSERNELELALMATRGLACLQVGGVGDAGAIAAYDRAEILCREMAPTPALGWALGGVAWMRFAGCQYDVAQQLAERMREVAQLAGDRVLRVSACGVLGMILGNRGDLEGARGTLEEGIAIGMDLGEGLPPSRFLVDPLVALRSNLAIVLAHLGRLDQAQREAQAAMTRADRLAQPLAQSQALRCAGVLEGRLGHPERVDAVAQEMEKLVVDHSLIQADGAGRCLRGLAQSQLGQPQAGLARIAESYAILKRAGMRAAYTQVTAYAAEAALRGADLETAQAYAEEGLALCASTRERVCLPDLLLMRARVALAKRDAGAARAALQASVEAASVNGAVGDELAAWLFACEEGLADATGRDRLATLIGSLRGGGDTRLVQRARAVLAGGATRPRA